MNLRRRAGAGAQPDPAVYQQPRRPDVSEPPAQRLNLITTELQEGVMKTRMQPIGNVWSKFPRVVRDLAVQCGKQVRDRDGGRRDRARQDDHRSDQGSADAPGAQRGRPRHRDARSRVARPASRRRLPCCCAPSTRAARSTSRSPTTAAASTSTGAATRPSSAG